MRNVQISIDEETLSRIDRIGKPLGLKRSEIVRRALQAWIREHAKASFEKDWIASLERHPDEPKRAEEWRQVQVWRDK